MMATDAMLTNRCIAIDFQKQQMKDLVHWNYPEVTAIDGILH